MWDELLSDGNTAEEALVGMFARLTELWRLHGLDAANPLTVTATSRAAGTIEQTIAEAGGEVTVTRVA